MSARSSRASTWNRNQPFSGLGRVCGLTWAHDGADQDHGVVLDLRGTPLVRQQPVEHGHQAGALEVLLRRHWGPTGPQSRQCTYRGPRYRVHRTHEAERLRLGSGRRFSNLVRRFVIVLIHRDRSNGAHSLKLAQYCTKVALLTESAGCFYWFWEALTVYERPIIPS